MRGTPSLRISRREFRVLVDAFPSDQHAQIRIDLWLTTSRSGRPTPVMTKTNTMSARHGFGSDNPKGIQHWRKPAIKPNEEIADRYW
jgi:hypothetical protein